MAKALVTFGETVLQSKSVSNEIVGPAYRQVVQAFLSLTTQINDESEPQDQPQKPRSEYVSKAMGPESTPSYFETLAEMQTNSSSSGETPALESLPLAKDRVSTDTAPDNVALRDFRSLPPGIILMPALNPLFSDDYSRFEAFCDRGPTLWKRLLHYGMLRSYRALECASEVRDNSQSWLARTHRFSLRYASRWQLMFLSKTGLERMMDPRHYTYGPSRPPIRADRVFGTTKHRELADAVRHDLEREGLWQNMLRTEDVDNYISTKGTTKLVGNRLELRLSSSTASSDRDPRTPEPGRGIRTVVLDVEKLVWRICEDSICMGDGIACPKDTVKKAIVYAAVHIGHGT
jgi:hypothetical protein